MSRKATIPVVLTEDPTTVVYIDTDAEVPEGFETPTERTITWPQSPATVLGWLTYDQLVEIANESDVENPTDYAKADLITAIMKAKGLIVFDAGDALAPTSGIATLSSGAVTISTTAVTANSVIVVTPMDAPDGRIYIGNVTAGTSFDVSSTELTDDCRVSWLLIEP